MATTREKLNLLPQKIQDALSSEIFGLINEKLCQKYGVRQIAQNTKILADLIFKDLAVNKLSATIAAAFGFNSEKSNQMALDLAGKCLLIFDDYFSGEVSKYIISLGGNLADYKTDIENQQKAIAQVRAEREKEEAASLNPPLPEGGRGGVGGEPVVIIESDDAEEKQHAPLIFKESILSFLSADSDELKEIIDDYNGVLIILLEKDNSFKKILEEALYENQELLGQNQINVNGKLVAPTIANWLNDFKSKHGTNPFTNVVLSEYLTSSENAKKLNPAEKRLLAKLLMLYRNLRFFPQGLAETSPEKWEIIPIDRAGQPGKFADQELPSPGAGEDEFNLHNMSPFELKAFMEANNLSEADLKKLKQ